MSDKAFEQGVKPGGIFRKNDVKLIICYMLSNIDTGLTKDDIVSILQENSIANYFESANAFSELIKQKNIFCCDEENSLFTTTITGNLIAEQLEVSLPVSLRNTVLRETINLLAKLKREKENTVEIIKVENGYMVKCIVSGTSVNLMELKLYAPDIMQANVIKENFLKIPEKFYTSVLSLATLI